MSSAKWQPFCFGQNVLTHWGRVMNICVGKTTIIGSDNGLLPGRRQAIIWTNAGILLIDTLGTNVSEILTECHSFSFKKMHIKMSSGKWRPSCLGLNVLMTHPNGAKHPANEGAGQLLILQSANTGSHRSVCDNLDWYTVPTWWL